jgi:hypothetical protein
VIILATGFPRSGTKWLANAFELNGLKVGHEKWHKNGGVGYMFSRIDNRKLVLESDLVIHLVRDPRKAIASAMKNLSVTTTLVKDFDGDWQQAWIYWNLQAEAICDHARLLGIRTMRINIEGAVFFVYSVLNEYRGGAGSYDLPPDDHNHRQDYPLLQWGDLCGAVKSLAARYGYKPKWRT